MIYVHSCLRDHGLQQIGHTLYHSLKDNFDCTLISDRINNAELKDNDIYILIFTYMEDILGNDIINRNIHIVSINTESFAVNKHQRNLINYLDHKSKNKSYILDYQSNNIKYFKQLNQNKNVEIVYLPPFYNKFYLKSFELYAPTRPIEPDIDVLFYGLLNHRRYLILNKLIELGYKVAHVAYFPSYEQHYEYIKKSKIVIDIYHYENNLPFDYYRLSFLLTNKIFTISETASDIDIELEPQLKDYHCQLIHAPYDRLVETVQIYLQKTSMERQNLANEQAEWFYSIGNYEQSLINLINMILNKN